MNIKSRIRKLYQAQKAQTDPAGVAPLLTLEQWERRYHGEDISAEIPEHRRAECEEFERVGTARINQAAKTMSKFEAKQILWKETLITN